MIRNSTVNRVFNDLDAYRNFCREYGFVFNEADLYRRNTPYGQYEKVRRGEYIRNNWELDAALIVESSHNTSH
jgi:hypothetical protein